MSDRGIYQGIVTKYLPPTAMTAEGWVALARERVVVNIGQLDAEACKALAREVRAGRLARWRGYWFPVAGAAWGMGPLKTCYGPPGWPRA